jgi:hypothetical protein
VDVTADVDPIRRALGELVSQVLERKQGTAPAWHDADVLITGETPSPRQPDTFDAPPGTVVTRFAAELSWLFERLHDAFAPGLDDGSKIEFFGRLADAANRYLTSTEWQKLSARDLLLAVLAETHAVIDEMVLWELR